MSSDGPWALLFPILLAAGSLCACGQDEIATYTVPKEAEASSAAAAAPAAGGAVAWTAPQGWKSEPAGGMRLATYSVPAAGDKCELSVVTLPGDAGGDLANVNRWRGQAGAAPVDAAGLKSQAGRLETAAGTLLTVDIKGEGGHAGQAVSAAILSSGESTWFFKLTGKEKSVAAARPAFRTFLKSLRPGSGS